MSLWRVAGRNPFSTMPKKLAVLIKNAVEHKVNMLEKKFLHKNVSYDHNFANAIETNELFVGGHLWTFEG